jgi:hypothetical protein
VNAPGGRLRRVGEARRARPTGTMAASPRALCRIRPLRADSSRSRPPDLPPRFSQTACVAVVNPARGASENPVYRSFEPDLFRVLRRRWALPSCSSSYRALRDGRTLCRTITGRRR